MKLSLRRTLVLVLFTQQNPDTFIKALILFSANDNYKHTSFTSIAKV